MSTGFYSPGAGQQAGYCSASAYSLAVALLKNLGPRMLENLNNPARLSVLGSTRIFITR
jgi:hypothetical protein